MQDDFMPLAARQAPKKIEDFAGQPHLLGEGKMLRRLLETDTLKSAVFFTYGISGQQAHPCFRYRRISGRIDRPIGDPGVHSR